MAAILSRPQCVKVTDYFVAPLMDATTGNYPSLDTVTVTSQERHDAPNHR